MRWSGRVAGVLACALVLVGPTSLSGQSREDVSWATWLTLGLGPGYLEDANNGFSPELAYDLQLTIQVGKHLFSAHGGGIAEWDRGSADAFSLLYGRAYAGRWGRLSVMAGPASVRVCDSYNTLEDCTTPGITAVFDAVLGGDAIGFGTQLFGNLNREQMYVGLVLTLQLGKMR